MLFHKYFAAFSFVALGLNLAPDNSVTITIENIKNTNGTIQIAIFDKSESFPKPGGEFKVAKYKIFRTENMRLQFIMTKIQMAK